MKSTIFKFIVAYSTKHQLRLLFMILVSMPFLYAVLEMPKMIFNDAISGGTFPVALGGFRFERVEYLVLLCVTFLGLVLVNGGFKYWVSVQKGLLGERMLRRLRFQLASQVMRFPLPHFRKMSQGEIITMITAEVEPLGGFIGDALAVPALEGGRMVTILVFMFMQDPYLGLAAISLYPFQIYLIPRLQKQVNDLAKKRVLAVRKLSAQMGESISGIKEIHAHDTSEYERAGISKRLGDIYDIRFLIYRKKFVIKFLNNFLAQMTPFFFYSIGGYLVIRGNLSFGALVAVLAAYKDLSSPWKDLLSYYQGMENARIKYQQLAEQFRPNGMLEPSQQGGSPAVKPLLNVPLTGNFLKLDGDNAITILDGATFQMNLGDKVCILSSDGTGKSELTQMIARLLHPDSGSIKVGEQDLNKLHEAVTGRRMAYVGENAALFSGTLRDNLFYGLKHEPLRAAAYNDKARDARLRWELEACEAGNATNDVAADWLDYEAAGVSGPQQLQARVLDVLGIVDLKNEIYEFGLNRQLDPFDKPEVVEKILNARMHLHSELQCVEAIPLFEPFDRKQYNTNLSVAENLLFGAPLDPALATEKLSANPYVMDVLDKVGLCGKFVSIGARLAEVMVDVFRDIPSDHEYFRRFSFIQADELPAFIQCVRSIEKIGIDALNEEDKRMLMSLPFNLVVARHHLNLIDDDFQKNILRAREIFAADLPEHMKKSVCFFDENAYNPMISIQDNILFGKPIYGRAKARQHIGRLVWSMVERFGLYYDIIEVGLDTEVGLGGSRLTAAQRQKVAIARAVLKRPDLLIVDSATSIMSPEQETAMMEAILKDVGSRGLLWVLERTDVAGKFEKVFIMEGGQVIEQGKIEDIVKSGSAYRHLVMS